MKKDWSVCDIKCLLCVGNKNVSRVPFFYLIFGKMGDRIGLLCQKV